jgi:tRNA(fMet)-specific endonuclease VapC
MKQVQNELRNQLDRIIDFTDDTALEAAYLKDRLATEGVSLDPVDLLNLATADGAGGTFITHNKNDFDEGPVDSLADVDVVHTSD